jgi:primosomal protein N'
VCGTNGTCANCGAADFGIVRGGAERVEEWARAVAKVPVRRTGSSDHPGSPGAHEVRVGGAEWVKDFGPLGLELVAILDADQAGRRPGLAARERALATWMDVAAWARPSGRVIVQTRNAGDPAVQSLVSGNPDRFHRSELPRRADAGFPAGWPVFRVTGDDRLREELAALKPRTLLSSSGEGQTVCLVALDPGAIRTFGRTIRTLADGGVVTRVEAEPHL